MACASGGTRKAAYRLLTSCEHQLVGFRGRAVCLPGGRRMTPSTVLNRTFRFGPVSVVSVLTCASEEGRTDEGELPPWRRELTATVCGFRYPRLRLFLAREGVAGSYKGFSWRYKEKKLTVRTGRLGEQPPFPRVLRQRRL